MDWKKYAFIAIITAIMLVHLLFTHIRNIRKNDFGRHDTVHVISQVADSIKSDYVGLKSIGYLAKDSSGMEYLSAYYQMRYCLAPVNLSRSMNKQDTILVLDKGQIDSRYNILKRYNHGYTLIIK